jgi:hypothetical protein
VAPVVTKAISKVPDPDPLSTVKLSVKSALALAVEKLGMKADAAAVASRAPYDVDAKEVASPLESNMWEESVQEVGGPIVGTQTGLPMVDVLPGT